MPNSASAKKRLRQNEARRLRHRATRSALRTTIKKVRSAIDAGEVEQSEAAFRTATKKLDQAAAKGILHANTAARYKSRLSAAIKKLKQPSAA